MIYADPFFVHANKMLILLQENGHLVSRTRTQSTAMAGCPLSIVMRVQAPKKNMVIKQFINSVDPAMADTQSCAMKELSALGLSPVFIDYIAEAEDGPVLVYEYSDCLTVGQSLLALHDAGVKEGAQMLSVEQADAALVGLPDDVPGRAALEANHPPDGRLSDQTCYYYGLLSRYIIQSYNLRNSQPEVADCYDRAFNTGLTVLKELSG